MKDRILASAAIGITFGMSGLAVVALAMDPSGRSTRRVAKTWGETMVSRLGIDLHVRGVERVDFSRPVVVMANHNSHLDTPILYAALPMALGMLAKSELFKFPIFGKAMRGVGCVPIERENRSAAHAAIGRAASYVRDGQSIVVFPEGTRGDGEAIRSFKSGPFHLAMAAGVPIVPIGIRGSAAICPRNQIRIYSGRVDVAVGDPIEPPVADGRKGLARERVALMGRVREAISELSGLPIAKAS